MPDSRFIGLIGKIPIHILKGNEEFRIAQGSHAEITRSLEDPVIVDFLALVIARDHNDDFAILANRGNDTSGNDPEPVAGFPDVGC